MRILERYLLREIVQAWLGMTLVLFVVLLSNQLATVLSRAAEGGFAGSVVFSLLWFAGLQQLVDLIPLGLFLGIMLALGRLYHENEMTAMQACGLARGQLLRPILGLALLVACLMAWLALFVAPQASQSAVDIRNDAMRAARFSSLQPGKFRSFGGAGNIVFYAESADEDGTLHNVYAERSQGDQVEIWTAKRAIQQGIGEQRQTFVLYDGERYEGVPGSSEFRIIQFKEGGIPVTMPGASSNIERIDARPTTQLLRSTLPEEVAELHLRLATPFLTVLLALLAVPLAKLQPRQGRYAKAGIFIFAYLLYRGLILMGSNVLLHGASPWIGMWWVHGLVAAVAWWLWSERSWQPLSLRKLGLGARAA